MKYEILLVVIPHGAFYAFSVVKKGVSGQDTGAKSVFMQYILNSHVGIDSSNITQNMFGNIYCEGESFPSTYNMTEKPGNCNNKHFA